MSGGPWDRGLQPERNDLAWRRTALGLTAGLALAVRFLAAPHPRVAVLLSAAALAAGALLMAAAARRAAKLDRRLRASAASQPVPPGARLLAVTAALAVLLAGTGAWLILSGFGPAGR